MIQRRKGPVEWIGREHITVLPWSRETAVERESLRKSKTAGDLWQLESETQILLGKIGRAHV